MPTVRPARLHTDMRVTQRMPPLVDPAPSLAIDRLERA